MRFAVTFCAIVLLQHTFAVTQAGDDLVPCGHWAYSALDYLTDGGIEFGFPSSERLQLSRSQFSTAVALALDSFEPESHPPHFGDVLAELRDEFTPRLPRPEENQETHVPPQPKLLSTGETAQQQELRHEREIPLDHWVYNAMDYLVSRGVLPAVFEGYFDGRQTLTCYEMQQMVFLVLTILDTEGLEEASDEKFGVYDVMAQTLLSEFLDISAEMSFPGVGSHWVVIPGCQTPEEYEIWYEQMTTWFEQTIP